MRSYIVVKALALSLGAFSVVARSLPEHRSEIKNRADGGGHGPSNPLTELEAAGAKIDTAVSNPATGEHFELLMPSQLTTLALLFHPHHGHNHAMFIPDIDDLEHRLEGMGLVMISEGMLNEKVYTAEYSMPASTNLSMPGTTLEKRDLNMEHAECQYYCRIRISYHPITDHCTVVYNELQRLAYQFSTKPRTLRFPS